jgi:hypothetical protein
MQDKNPGRLREIPLISGGAMRRFFILVFVALLAGGHMFAQASKPQDPWAPLNFLLGEWEGVGTGTPGEAVGGTSFAFDLDKRILVRKNWAKYPPKPGDKTGLSHEDLMIIYTSSGESVLRAIYFDNEDYVINYTVLPLSNPGVVVFETDPAQKGPRFRLVYELNAAGTLKNVFLIASPGEEFKVYAQGTLKKK